MTSYMLKEALLDLMYELAVSFYYVVTSAAYAIVLIGGTVCMILYVAGWDEGMKYTGLMFVGYILFRAIVGSVVQL